MENISISNYKNIAQLSLSGLKRFNLFVGANNTGKSTLLEAVYILSTSGNFAVIRDILEQRGYNLSNVNREDQVVLREIISSLISGRSFERFYLEGIRICSDQKNVFLQLADSVYENDYNENTGESYRVRRVVVYKPGDDMQNMGNKPTLQIDVDGEKRDSVLLEAYRYNFKPLPYSNLSFVRTSGLIKENNAFLYDRVSMTPLEDELVMALQIIEPRIKAINFLKNNSARSFKDPERLPYVLLNDGQKIQLSSMGDGINRILSIALSLLSCQNGIFLIDEFENGLHYSVQTKLWEIIKRLSHSLNIQVFVSTHSTDCLKSFLASNDLAECTVTRLENVDGTIIPIQFQNEERLIYAIENNIEIR